MRRLASATLGVLVTLVALSGPATGQSTDEIAREAVENGSYVSPGADVDANRLDDVVADASGAGTRFIAVILDEDPPGGSSARTTAINRLPAPLASATTSSRRSASTPDPGCA